MQQASRRGRPKPAFDGDWSQPAAHKAKVPAATSRPVPELRQREPSRCFRCSAVLTANELRDAHTTEGHCYRCLQPPTTVELARCAVCEQQLDDNEVDEFLLCSHCGDSVHAICDTHAMRALQDHAQRSYECATCRNRAPEWSQQALQQREDPQQILAGLEEQLRGMRPVAPQHAYALFSDDMYRVYRDEGYAIDPKQLNPLIAQAWHQLTREEMAAYDARVLYDTNIYNARCEQYDGFYANYVTTAMEYNMPIDYSLCLDPQAAALARSRRPQPTLQQQQQQQQQQQRARMQHQAYGHAPQQQHSNSQQQQQQQHSGGQLRARQSSYESLAYSRQASPALAAPPSLNKKSGRSGSTGRQRQRSPTPVVSSEDFDNDSGGDFALPKSKKAKFKTKGKGAAAEGVNGVSGSGGTKRTAAAEVAGGQPAAKKGKKMQLLGQTSGGTKGGHSNSARANANNDGGNYGPAHSMADMPLQFLVGCNGMTGTFIMDPMTVICHCRSCNSKPADKRHFHPTHWEVHAGILSAKKWKASLRIEPGMVAEVPHGSVPMQIGRWFDLKGIEFRPARTLGGPPVLEFTGSSIARGGNTYAADPRPARPPATAGERVVIERVGGTGRGPGRPLGSTNTPKVYVNSSTAPWNDVLLGNFQPVRVRWAGDRCCVCDSDVDYDSDQLVSCDRCGIAVHQSCYGIAEAPGLEDMWMCRGCELRGQGKPEPQCCVCPITGGALKPTTLPGLWCHAACLQWIPEITCVDSARMEPIDRIQFITKDRWDLACCVCKQRMGAKIQCNSCYAAYHPLCGRMAGLNMQMVEPDNGPLKLTSYCPKHCKPRPDLSGVTPLRAGGDDDPSGDGSINGLWNGQPYRPPPALPVRPCHLGCARAQPLERERTCHGTGAGWTTLKGFWIPELSQQQTQQLQHAANSHKKGASGRKGRPGGKGGGIANFGKLPFLVRPPPPVGLHNNDVVGGVMPYSNSNKPPSSGKSHKAKPPPTGPPPETELLPLPDGLPERVPIICNGKRAEFLLRSQTVWYHDSEISASRFEALCGKGDAKKWKTSIWYEVSEGVAEMQMQDWLSANNLERALLTKLQVNAAAHAAHQRWLAAEKEEAEGGGEEAAEEGMVEGGDADALSGNGAHAAANGTTASPVAAVPGDAAGKPAEVAAAGAGDSNVQTTEAGTANDNAARGQSKNPTLSCQPADVQSSHSPACAQLSQQPNVGRASSLQASPSAPDLAASALPDGQPLKSVTFAPDTAALPKAAPAPPRFPLQKLQDAEELAAVLAAAIVLRCSAKSLVVHKRVSDVCLPPGSATATPEACCGHCCRVYWCDDFRWYDADVLSYDAESGHHRLWYHADEQSERLDLRAEEGAGRVQWLPYTDAETWPEPPPQPVVCRLRPSAPHPHLRGSRWHADSKAGLSSTAAASGIAAAAGSGAGGDAPQESEAPPQPGYTWRVEGMSDAGPTPEGGHVAPDGAAAVSSRVGIWCPDRQRFMYGRIDEYRETDALHKVRYDSNLSEWLALDCERVEWVLPAPLIAPTPPPVAAPAVSAAALSPGDEGGSLDLESGAEAADEPAAPVPIPDLLGVICNEMSATYRTGPMDILLDDGRVVSPTEFERLAGKGASKKWKVSVRVKNPDGTAGVTIAEWLIEVGLEKPRAVPAPALALPVGLDAVRRRQNAAMVRRDAADGPDSGGGGAIGARTASGSAASTSGKDNGGATTATAAPRVHRAGCLCVICKQTRKSQGASEGDAAAAAGGTGTDSAAAAAGAGSDQPSTKEVKPFRQPRLRLGKRAYIPAVPQLLGGASQHRRWAIPVSRSWDPSEWSAAQAEPCANTLISVIKSEVDAGEAHIKLEGTHSSAQLQLAYGRVGGTSAKGRISASAEAAAAELDAGGGDGAAERERAVLRGMTWKERMFQALQSEHERVTFGKSGIHGWGIFARRDIPQDAVVVEYRGDMVRPIVADLREKRYRAQGRDCYLFHANETAVCDSTLAGNFGRFTNHCCGPSLYVKVLEMGGFVRLAFCARTDIRAGQELTYDYRFKEEDGDAKLICSCGAPNCRGTLN